MIELLKILLFSKFLLLTSNAITIKANEPYTINFEEPISAITEGATIQISIPHLSAKNGKTDIHQIRKTTKKTYPKSSIKAQLISTKNQTITLSYSGYVGISSDDVFLLLGKDEKTILNNLKFKKLTLKSEVDLRNVKIYWKNYKI